tara:strand:- start:5202 stop:5423 length:222 start_codon:yes stop_codon:yes gene_type:complete
MADFSIKISDTKGGGLSCFIEANGFKDAMPLDEENTCAKSIYFLMMMHLSEIGLDVPKPAFQEDMFDVDRSNT